MEQNRSPKRKYWFYVLKLEQNKYYLGVTSKTPEKRFQQHKNGYMAARWTKQYKPIEIIDTKDLGEISFEEAVLFESRATRKYMQEKGINNVRGGDLTDETDYVKRFDRFFKKDDWIDFKYIVFFIGLLAASLVLYYLK